MIRKYRYGTPFETDSVVNKMETSEDALPYFTEENEDGRLSFSCTLSDGDCVYGLGENVRGINKRGWMYESRCLDDPVHVETCRSLYAAHNFLIISGEKTFGIFLDYPGIVSYDIGYTHLDRLVITVEEPDLDIYIIDGGTEREIVRELRHLTGRSYIPPKWAFGYQQCRWSYMSEDEVRDVVKGHRQNHIPLDAVYLDIDYMDHYKDFTVNEETFPKFDAFVKEMRDEHIRLVPIIDAGIKIEKGYKTYEEGVKNGYFCKNEDGSDFVGGVWPGRVHFPDPLNKKAREWFGESYRFLIDKGIEGFWNDMNEPALFYSAAGLDRLFNEVRKFEKQNMEISVYNEFLGLVGGLPNNREDYLRIYHNADGKKIRHDKVHNLYGYGITRAAGEAFEKISPEKRILLFSRSSCIGMHRYAGIWMGDNKSWWSHLLMNLKMLPSLNMVGILYTGADIGGFGADTTEDLVLRWTQLAVFNPLMRNHSAMGTRRQEAYRFDRSDALRKIIGIRYSLIPYLYSEFMKAALKDDMMFRPLSFDYPEDTFARQVEDQVMVGDGLMIAPVYTQNAAGRYVYLPERMLMIRAASADEYECRILEAGHHYIDVPLNEMVFFLRPGHLLPLVRPAESVDGLNTKKLKVIGWKGTASSYDLYDDDGESRNYSLNEGLRTIRVSEDGIPEAEGDTAPELSAELY